MRIKTMNNNKEGIYINPQPHDTVTQTQCR